MGNKVEKIAVIMPPPSSKPIGGYKIIYKYCDLLLSTNENFRIDFYYTYYTPNGKVNMIFYLFRRIVYKTLRKDFYKWYNFVNANKIFHNIGLRPKNLKKSDLIFVSSVETAFQVKKLNLSKKVFYFIQGFEDWNMPKSEVVKSYKFGFKNIVVSKWLQNILKENNAPVSLWLSNPVEENFYESNKISSRKIQTILFMYHPAPSKGSYEALEGLKKIKKKFSAVQISCFSAFPKPNYFPDWIDFHFQPTKKELRELMNEHFIFLSSSYQEGFGLPPAEAMNCGCCIITTKSGGVEDFAEDKKTAYLVESPPNPIEISNKIEEIFNNRIGAIKIARNGRKNIKKITWQKNLGQLIILLNKKD